MSRAHALLSRARASHARIVVATARVSNVQPDGGHVLRVRGRCLSRQVYVVTVPPGLNPGDQVAEATEDILAPHPSDGGASAAPIGEAVAAGWQVTKPVHKKV